MNIWFWRRGTLSDLKIFIIFQCLKWYIKLSEQELVEKFFSLYIIAIQGFKSLPLHTFLLDKDLNNEGLFIFLYGGMTLIRKGLAVVVMLLFLISTVTPMILADTDDISQ
ncbi:MAG TPA: hypothetical protein DSN98_05850, partial [Thermoplasmata archaeon]